MAKQRHELKCRPNYFDATERGEKNFEVRRDDRGFQKGDEIILIRTREDRQTEIEYDYHGKKRTIQRTILYVLTGGQFGIEPGWVVLGLQE